MKYISQRDGSYYPVSEDSDFYKKVKDLPEDQTSVRFLQASNKKVAEWLAKQAKKKKCSVP